MKKCPKCGAQNHDWAKFCGSCEYQYNKSQNKKKTSPYLIILLVVICLISAYFGSYFIPIIIDIWNNPDLNLYSCTEIKLTDCDLDNYGGSVYGTVINKCKSNVHMVEITTSVFSPDGILLDTDKEYLENIKPGEQKTFEALLGPPASKGKRCGIKIESLY